MAATAINHVNLPVDDLDRAVDFYESVLDLERIPAVNSSAPGAWFRVGDAQLHLTERGSPAPEIHHVALTVDDFPAVYDAAVERDALDETFGASLYEFPDGAVQLYFRDPSGNLLEADWPDVSTLPARIRDHVQTRAAVLDAPQTGEAREASLFPDYAAPPSISSTRPEMASVSANSRTAFATSSGLTSRPMGEASRRAGRRSSGNILVSTAPGATTFAKMPSAV